jgi:hypothetical protein
VNPRSRQLLCVLMTWVVLAQPSLASVLGPEHAFAGHGGAEVHVGDGRHWHPGGYDQPGAGASQAPEPTRAALPSPEDGAHHHGCDHACHACAHFPGLPPCMLPAAFPELRNGISWYCASWRSQPRSPPERPPRAIA